MSDLALLNASLIQQLLGSAALKHISGSYLLLFWKSFLFKTTVMYSWCEAMATLETIVTAALKLCLKTTFMVLKSLLVK